MEPSRARPVALIMLAIVALLLWWSTTAPWWASESTDISLSGFDGAWFRWTVIAACAAGEDLNLTAGDRRVAVGHGRTP